MTEKLIMQKNNIPDGMLHDQDLYEISLENGILILGFDIFLSKEEYGCSDFAKKYFEYKKCHIKCHLEDKSYCDVRLETSLDKHSKGKFRYLSISDFIEIANKVIKRNWHPWEYLYTYISPNTNYARIELAIYDMKYKGTNYAMCTFELETTEIEFIWE